MNANANLWFKITNSKIDMTELSLWNRASFDENEFERMHLLSSVVSNEWVRGDCRPHTTTIATECCFLSIRTMTSRSVSAGSYIVSISLLELNDWNVDTFYAIAQ